MKLGLLADMQMGYPFRSRLEHDPRGNVSVIQMKDIDNANQLHADVAFKEACRNSGHPETNHFEDVLDMVEIGSGAMRQVADIHLSRYACYLIVQNGDPAKPVIANGQTYFALQTRRQEMSDDAILYTADTGYTVPDSITGRAALTLPGMSLPLVSRRRVP